MPSGSAADWTSHPEDVTHVLQFLYERRSRMGDGGNFDKTVLNEAAAHMASQWPPKKGGPKTAKAIETKWKAKQYPGASGWTYTDENGFKVTDDTREAWDAHPHFKPFATKGCIHFKTVDDMMPEHARGRYIYNTASELHAEHGIGLSQPSQDDDAQTQSSDVSQPISNWSQTQFGDDSQNSFGGDSSFFDPNDDSATSQASAGPSQEGTELSQRSTSRPPTAQTKKRPSSDVEAPWSNKQTRTTGPESIMALGRSVEGIGKVIETVFAPKTSSAMSPPRKVQEARRMALEDFRGGYIVAEEHTRLNILFGRDISTADAYIADQDPFLRAETGRELLNPTPSF
ncbi:hypothetical protein C8F04DRAFT_1356370 [Mycena alexandri]|uniref:Uncharacterized protein n=1 Tax=Mycena alexandri TaxID=1745969 RepID=A0AAD6RW91_9AGAR|nr:hypothetical protein C8F04DRAFT_1356370 [Mycena alexandri]